ncbi:MAG: LysR family transcriptional regulator [Clostridia bacterium]|nr:LysR family transcriptional regulator [Clostridia bacterium]
MQTSYLQYMIEIDRTRSITQAAANLYMSQPSLSRILHELEEQLGFALFERSNRGVRPTPAGVGFMQHARRILNEVAAIEGLGSGKRAAERFHICMPRSAGILDLAAEYLNTLPADRPLDAVLRECHVRQSFEYIASGEADLAVIRFRREYQHFFEDQALANDLSYRELNSYRYRIVIRGDNPLAEKAQLKVRDLAALTEITHGDTFRTQRQEDDAPRRHIYSVDRQAQLTLLQRIPGAFMWTTSMLPEQLACRGLVQRDVSDNRVEYQNAVISVAPGLLNEIESGFIEFVASHCGR